MNPTRGLAASLLCLALAACVSPTDPFGREDALEEAQKKYTELIRWGDVQRAGAYVEPELRDDFLALADAMQDLRITDFEIGEIDFDHDSASVTVTYRGYLLNEFVERQAHEVQQWRRDGLKNDWRVRPELHDVVAAIEGREPGARRN